MLLNNLRMIKKVFLYVILLSIFTSISYAEICEVDRAKDILRKNLYLHLTSSSSPLTIDEVKDILTFYLTISPGLVTIDCSSTGLSSNLVISDILADGESAADVIPTCSDGTKYGKCSATKPKFCHGGSIKDDCISCGCPSSNSCDNANGNCNPLGGITCFNNLDCGANQFTGNYYCSNS